MGTVIKTIQTSSSALVRLVISDKNWLESSAVDQLKKTAELPGMCCAVGLPDLHPGKGQPIGAAFISKNVIYPHIVGNDIGCGMGLWALDAPLRKVKINQWEKKLSGLDERWDQDGDAWLESKGLIASDNFLAEANKKLGTIGGGNHFAEIQAVNTVFDNEALSLIGLHKQSVVLLAHSGSRGLGEAILRDHIDRYGARGLATHSEGSVAASEYMRRHDYAVKWAVENRELIAWRFCERLGVKGERLLDVPHNTVTPLNTLAAMAMTLAVDNAEHYWIHRKGASPTDQGMVMIPGSRGSVSYLVKLRELDIAQLAQGGFSLAHGAGRKWKRSDARSRLEQRFKANDLITTQLGGRVICENKALLYEEAPQAYKNIDLVISDLVDAGMIDLIASFKPLITYKTRSKHGDF